MKEILVIYHSMGGNTRKMAQAAADGVGRIEGACAKMRSAGEATLEDLLSCDGMLIGSPEYFGYMAGAIKDFFDRTYEKGHTDKRVFRKPFTLFISAGNDGTGALTSIERICRGYSLKKVFEPIIVTGDIQEADLERCVEAGQTIAAGCVAEIY